MSRKRKKTSSSPCLVSVRKLIFSSDADNINAVFNIAGGKKMLNKIKNIAIILDFIISMVAYGIQNSNAKLSGNLYMVSAIVLLIAFVCVVIELFKKKSK